MRQFGLAEPPKWPRHGSRFDFLLRRGGERVLMEVKSVTLFGNGMAMFPDAPTLRGRRHLEELAHLGSRAQRPVVLFLAHSRRVDRFMPDYHTDLDFARTLLRLRSRLDIVAAAIGWRPALGLPRRVDRLNIPWEQIDREAQDRGAYLLLLRLSRARTVRVGKLGTLRLSPGHYVYLGSAMRNLTARINRHLRKRKILHWHIDHLRAVATEVTALPIRASRRLECDPTGVRVAQRKAQSAKHRRGPTSHPPTAVTSTIDLPEGTSFADNRYESDANPSRVARSSWGLLAASRVYPAPGGIE